MQSSEAARLQQQWGGKPCVHPDFEREYYLGSSTGDFVCTTCGADVTRKERDAILEQRRQQ